VTKQLFYSRGSRKSKVWYLTGANHPLLLTKEAEAWFSSLFSHEHNDSSLPSTLAFPPRWDEKGIFRQRSHSFPISAPTFPFQGRYFVSSLS